jgi:hypothetical protein
MLQQVERLQQLLARVGKALAERRHLSGHVVAAPRDGGAAVLGCQVAQAAQRCHRPGAHQPERLLDLKLLDVLREIA